MVVKAFETITLARVDDGSDGAPGKPGVDGKTPYFHTAWADSSDGKINFNLTDATNRGYLGTYTDFEQADSKDPTKYAWTELVGNLAIGGRNYLADTSTPWQMQGSGDLNQTGSMRWLFTFKTIRQAPFKDGEYVTVSFDYTSVGTGEYGTILAQFSNTPWELFEGIDVMQDSGHVMHTTQWKSSWTTSGNATGIRIRMDNVATTRTVTVYNMKFERGNKATDWTKAPEDTQQQIDTINKGLADTNTKIAAVPKVDAQAGAPTNPKKGDQWWVKDANGEINGLNIWDGTKWAPSTITQSLLVIKELDAVNINGSTINGSKFTNSFDFKNLSGVQYQGVTTIADGGIKIAYKIPSTGETGTTTLTAESYKQIKYNKSGSMIGTSTLNPNNLALSDGNEGGFLRPYDLIRYGPEDWTNSGTDGVKYTIRLELRWGRVWLSGVQVLPAANFGTGGDGYRTIFNIKNKNLIPATTRWVKCTSMSSAPHSGLLEFRPNGDVVAIGVPTKGRYSFEGESYTIENL